jgi:transcriptional regulator with XRE-family HTH domain
MLGMTQEQLAQNLNISYQQVQKYETGANRVSAGRLYDIAGKLDVDIAYFFEGVEPSEERGRLPHGGTNRSTIDLASNFSEISEPGIRAAISGLVKTLAKRKDSG